MNETRARQAIRYLRTTDGVRLAWAEAGRGHTLVKAANWLTRLELEWQSPVWRHWIRFFSDNFRFVRYDERGCGHERLGGPGSRPGPLGRGPRGGRHRCKHREHRRHCEHREHSRRASDCRRRRAGGPPRHLAGCGAGDRVRGPPSAAGEPPDPLRWLRPGWAIRGNKGSRQATRRCWSPSSTAGGGAIRCSANSSPRVSSRAVPTSSSTGSTSLSQDDLANAVRLLQTRAQVDVHRHLAEVRVPTLVLHARN